MTLDWNNLKFEYLQTRSFIKYVWNGVCWDDGALITEPYINLHVDATCLHYGQSCFEGLKAFHMADEKIRIFRPLLNAKRLQSSCKAVSLEPPPFDLFLEALRRVVADNSDFVPPYGSGGSLYIRPFVIGSGVKIGLSPSPETTFMIFVNPVGNYYAGGIGSPVKALIMHGFDRAAPRGTGNVKVGGNYAPCLRPSLVARKKGYTITLFLDAKTGKVCFY
jgi:branched-chain amino acid aminotransferase